MNTLIVENLVNAYNEACEKIIEVYNIFVNQFGEENVDLQKPTIEEIQTAILPDIPNSSNIRQTINDSGIDIIVHFPTVRVMNEFNRYIDINDLYVKIPITIDGKCSYDRDISMIRSTFSKIQYLKGYIHSHLPRLVNNQITWKQPCFGTGPIRNTLFSIRNEYSPALWGLFAYELSKYVETESVQGSPFIRLESITTGIKISDSPPKTINIDNTYLEKIMSEFMSNYIQNNIIKFSYKRGQYFIGEDYISFYIKLSNAFIKWVNNTIMLSTSRNPTEIRNIFLDNYIVSDNNIYYVDSCNNNPEIDNDDQPVKVLNFKGSPIFLRLLTDAYSAKHNNISVLLQPTYVNYIITKLLLIISVYYGNRKHFKTNTETTDNSAVTKTCKRNDIKYFIHGIDFI